MIRPQMTSTSSTSSSGPHPRHLSQESSEIFSLLFKVNLYFSIIYTPGRDKLRGRLATQIFHLLVVSAHKQYFCDKKYSILTFHYKTASVIEFMVTHANIL